MSTNTKIVLITIVSTIAVMSFIAVLLRLAGWVPRGQRPHFPVKIEDRQQPVVDIPAYRIFKKKDYSYSTVRRYAVYVQLTETNTIPERQARAIANIEYRRNDGDRWDEFTVFILPASDTAHFMAAWRVEYHGGRITSYKLK